MGISAAIMFGLKAGADVIGGIGEANAQREQAKYQEHMYEVNAKLAEDQGKDAIQAGDLEANKLESKAGALRSTQRVSYANQGVDVNTGAAAETQADTVALSKLDALTIKNNAWRQAWGYRVEAINSRSQGAFARAAGESRANSTLLTAGIKGLGDVLQGANYLKGGGSRVPKFDAEGSGAGGGYDGKFGRY